MLHFGFWISQLSEIELQSWNLRNQKTDFSEKGLVLLGLKGGSFIIVFLFVLFFSVRTNYC